jgi:hypothetical protein
MPRQAKPKDNTLLEMATSAIRAKSQGSKEGSPTSRSDWAKPDEGCLGTIWKVISRRAVKQPRDIVEIVQHFVARERIACAERDEPPTARVCVECIRKFVFANRLARARFRL